MLKTFPLFSSFRKLSYEIFDSLGSIVCQYIFIYHHYEDAMTAFHVISTGSLHNSSIRIGSDGLSVICGDDLDKTENEESATVKDKENEEKDVAEKSEEKTAAEKEAEHIGKGIHYHLNNFSKCQIHTYTFYVLENHWMWFANDHIL